MAKLVITRWYTKKHEDIKVCHDGRVSGCRVRLGSGPGTKKRGVTGVTGSGSER